MQMPRKRKPLKSISQKTSLNLQTAADALTNCSLICRVNSMTQGDSRFAIHISRPYYNSLRIAYFNWTLLELKLVDGEFLRLLYLEEAAGEQ